MRRTDRVLVVGLVVVLAAVLVADRVGSVARAESASSAEMKVASFDVYDAINAMINEPARVAKRDEVVKHWNDRLTNLEKDITTLQSTLKVLPPQDPEFKKVEAQLNAKIGEMQQARQEGLATVERFQAEQLVEIYTKVASVAVAVAEERGYTHVIAARKPMETIEPKTQDTVLQEILARPLLVAPTGDDITPHVRAKLGV